MRGYFCFYKNIFICKIDRFFYIIKLIDKIYNFNNVI